MAAPLNQQQQQLQQLQQQLAAAQTQAQTQGQTQSQAQQQLVQAQQLAAAQAQAQAGQPALTQQQQQQAQQQDDSVAKFKLLIPQLKDSLQNLMRIAAQNLSQNTTIDNGQKSNDTALQRFDKSLEEFYALCDQVELCLRLAFECLSQSIDSAKHSPNLVPTATKPDTVQTESLSYAQYLSMIKSQISCAKDIHNALLECSKRIASKGQI
ncbi:mediator of RNA polymerase II transcription subunit 29 [Leucoraja erinacea]|uniref:mediator of RNA polymerase II transcription subunit 29 n=1 Tax=Leucoraja erinaceus TaxID=7782 RepID=UPI002456DD11|nr:mediator of RNA polymerase II transcription subunit 29 [Leucoraja erinacea]